MARGRLLPDLAGSFGWRSRPSARARSPRGWADTALVAGLALLVASEAAPVGAETLPADPVSVLQVPLDIDLRPLFAAAESALPTEAGDWPKWRDWHGILTRYRAWRGPLALSMQGDTLVAQAHVRYRVQARKELIAGLKLKAGCGVKEPPRQALIGLAAQIDWAPDWTLHPRFRVLPTRFIDRCEVTAADIDVSPLVGDVFESRLKSSLSEGMQKLAPKLGAVRAQAASAWQSAQTPREISPGLWLHIEPLGIALAPPVGSGAQARTAVRLALRARLSGEGAVPNAKAPVPIPLPPLLPYMPTEPGLRFALNLKLDYPTLSGALTERLGKEPLAIDGKSTRIERVSLAAKGADLVVTADLAGDLAGRLTIMSRPAFDAVAQVLKLENVDFTFDTKRADLDLLVGVFYKRIRARIESAVNQMLAERTGGLRDGLAHLLEQSLPDSLTPDLSSMRISRLQIKVGEGGLFLDGTAEGVLSLGSGALTAFQRPE